MPASTELPSLWDRWLAAASEDTTTDREILGLIENCCTGISINEAELLRAIVQHANEIAARDDHASARGAAGADIDGATA